MTANRCSYRPYQIPFLLDSTVYDISRCAIDFRPFGDVFCYTINFDISVLSVIVVLLFSCRPPAVAWLVISAIIDSINGVFGSRPWSHIRKEIYKPLSAKPSIMNNNSTPSIIYIARMIRVYTALNHAAPSFVFNCSGFAMCLLRSANSFIAKTSTRLSDIANQIRVTKLSCCPAITSTQIETIPINRFDKFKDSKPIEFLTYYVFSLFDHISPFVSVLYHKNIDMKSSILAG